ncbi:MAG TPA: hypothetical protein VKF81_07590 [Blastocatellia bacterium]|nr:hypothetical protein [Blastocatellia bacterium]
MKKQPFSRLTMQSSFVMLAALILGSSAKGQLIEGQGGKKTLMLTATGPASGSFGRSGQAGAVVLKTKGGGTTLRFSLSGLKPNAAHTVWLIFDTNQPPFSQTSGGLVATDSLTGTTAPVFGFAPAAADNAAFTAGVGLDPNGFVTDASGNAEFKIDLNFDILQPASAPVVLRPGATQVLEVASDSGSAPCVAASGGTFQAVIDSNFMRVFDTSKAASPPVTSPSFQTTDAPLKARLVRGTVKALTIAEHFDGLTHGHLPGANFPASGSCGDWAARLTGALANASQ